jgi:hypothetical protein
MHTAMGYRILEALPVLERLPDRRSSIAGTRSRQDRELSVSPPVRRLGDLDDQNKQANDHDLKCGERLLSLYDTEAGPLCVFNERDRSTTNVLLRTEY